jgi:hypothetical protein
MAGHLNGKGSRVGDDGNVASLAEARLRAASRAKAEARAARHAMQGTMTARDWIIGAVVVAMALGMIGHWLAPLVEATGVTR